LRVGDILSRIFKVKCGYLGVESYSSAGEGKVSDVQNELTFARDLSTTSKVYGENVLVTDDLIDTGVTLEKTLSWLKNYKDFANKKITLNLQFFIKKKNLNLDQIILFIVLKITLGLFFLTNYVSLSQ